MNDHSNPLLTHLCLIDGQWQEALSGERFTVSNPATQMAITDVPNCSAADTESAIAAAHKALAPWSAHTATSRSTILQAWYRSIFDHRETLAEIITLESGKPIGEARTEVDYGASFIAWFAAEGLRAYGDTIPANTLNREILVKKKPVGVCSAITPWNFPFSMVTRKCAPALAAGCTVVLKPAAATPLTALALAKLAEESGIPKGVFNVVTSSKSQEVGEVLSTHPLVRKLSFTGSTDVGKKLMAQAAGSVKRVSMELGGNAPFIIFEDADIDKAIEGARLSKFRHAGQTCVCANRFLVHQSIKADFIERFTEEIQSLKVGDGMEEATDLGPLINRGAVEKVATLIQEAVDQGAKCLTGGSLHLPDTTFFTPTLIDNVSQDMRIVREEIFGPVAPVMTFQDEAEAIAIANDTPYGLAAYFYTRDLSRTFRVANALSYGMVGINEGIISTTVAPFGGIKESGIGREGSHQGLEEYLDTQYLCIGTTPA